MPEHDQHLWLHSETLAIGRRVHAARMDANLTQEILGELIGRDRRTIQRIEAGGTDPRLSWLLLISRVLGVPIGSLLSRDPGST